MKRILTIAAAALIASTAGPALAQSLGGSAGGALSGGSSGVTTDSQLSGSGTTQPRRLLPDTQSAAPADEDGAAGTAGASAASENDPDAQTNPAAPNATAGTTVQPGASGSGEAAADTTEGGDTQLRAGSSADADADQMAPSGETTASIDLTTEQRTEARQLFVDTAPVNLDINVSIGTAVPRTVEVHTLPPRFIEIVPQYRGYSYIVLADGRILILEPRTYEIVYILS